MNTPPQMHAGTINIRSSVLVSQPWHIPYPHSPQPGSCQKQLYCLSDRTQLSPWKRQERHVHDNHQYCRDGPGANNKLQLSLYHLMWLAAWWVGPKLRIVGVTPNWPILQINEVHISKNLRSVALLGHQLFFLLGFVFLLIQLQIKK